MEKHPFMALHLLGAWPWLLETDPFFLDRGLILAEHL
jgi:hypothetical protein